ncbi:MAG: sulfotransferase domain-containing protein [Myxococcota bacterium]
MGPSKFTSGAFALTSRALDAAIRNLDHARRIANFLRGRAEFEVRRDDVFISSYPRSGTTLTQWMVYLLSHGCETEPAHITEVSPWFERSLAIGEHTAKSLDAYPSPRVFKSHLPREWLPDGARYIYVERDGQDVLLSYYNLYRDYLGFDGDLDAFHRRFVAGKVQYGSWFDHVEGWHLHASSPNVLMLRYESLRSERKKNAERIAEFLQLDVAGGALDQAVSETSLEAMKAREHVFDHATALLLERGVHPRSFIRTGSVGEGGLRLSEEQKRAFTETRSTGRLPAIRELAAFLQ